MTPLESEYEGWHVSIVRSKLACEHQTFLPHGSKWSQMEVTGAEVIYQSGS